MMIVTENVTKSYHTPAGTFPALCGVDLRVAAGEFVALVGKGRAAENRVDMVGGIDRPTSGNLTVGGVAICKMSENSLAAWRGRHVGLVFQSFHLRRLTWC